MKNPCIYIKNMICMAVRKIRYGRRITVGIIQSFEKIKIKIAKDGFFHMGSYNQNRGELYIGVLSGGKLLIGNHCFFNINASITCAESIEIGDNCKFGNNLVIVDHDHNFRGKDKEFLSSPIKIGNNVWVGANVVILKGSVIGDGCVIAAGSVVKDNIPAKTILIPHTDVRMGRID